MARRHFVPKSVLAARMREQIKLDAGRAVEVACECPRHRTAQPAPAGRRPVGAAWCPACRHYAHWSGGRVTHCVTEPRVALPGFRPDLSFETEPIPDDQDSAV